MKDTRGGGAVPQSYLNTHTHTHHKETKKSTVGELATCTRKLANNTLQLTVPIINGDMLLCCLLFFWLQRTMLFHFSCSNPLPTKPLLSHSNTHRWEKQKTKTLLTSTCKNWTDSRQRQTGKPLINVDTHSRTNKTDVGGKGQTGRRLRTKHWG